MAFLPYVDPAEFKLWTTLNDNIDDAVIYTEVATVTQWIDEVTDRHFWQDGATGAEVARTFESCYQCRLDIDDLVPGSVTAFKTDEDGDGTFETTWAASDYQLLPVNKPTGINRPHTNVEAIAGRLFPVRYSRQGRVDRVQITGIWGWPAVPLPVKQACKLQVNRILKRRYSPEGVAGFGEFGAIRVTRLDPDIQQDLQSYMRTAVLVA